MAPAESEAERRYRRLAPDQARRLEELRVATEPYPDLHARVAPILQYVAEAPEGFDLSNAYLRVPHVDPMVETIKRMRLGLPSVDVDLLLFGMLPSDEVLAETSALSDGSGLVLVSEGLLGLCIHLALVNSLWLDPIAGTGNLRRALWAIRAVRKGAADQRAVIGGALLRYHLVHQRVHGNAGKLTPILSETGRQLAELLTMCAVQFICAHEAAHFVLGHSVDPVGLLTVEELPIVENSEALEYAADAVAARIVLEHHEELHWPALRVVSAGVSLALSSIALMEGAGFVRRARTHPPAAQRWRALSRVFDAAGADRLLTGMHHAVHVGGNPYAPLPEGAWNLMVSSGLVSRENHGDDYLEANRQLDALFNVPTERYLDALPRMVTTGRTLRDGLLQAQSGDLPVAMRTWGVPPRRAAQLLDKRHSLGFYTTVDAFMRCEQIAVLASPTQRRFTAAALATILGREHRW